MNANTSRRTLTIVLSSLAIAAALTAAVTLPPSMRGQSPAVASVPAQAPVVGVATSEVDRGLPVYRLPTVAVTASRSEELAKMAREETLALNK